MAVEAIVAQCDREHFDAARDREARERRDAELGNEPPTVDGSKASTDNSVHDSANGANSCKGACDHRVGSLFFLQRQQLGPTWKCDGRVTE